MREGFRWSGTVHPSIDLWRMTFANVFGDKDTARFSDDWFLKRGTADFFCCNDVGFASEDV